MTVRCRRGPLRSLPFAAVSLAVVGSAAAQTYTVVDLGTLGGSPSTASAINNANQIVGWSVNAEQATRPFLWSHGVLSDLGSLGPNGFAYGINNSGEVAGYSSTPNPEWPGCGKVGYCLESSDEATIWSKGTNSSPTAASSWPTDSCTAPAPCPTLGHSPRPASTMPEPSPGRLPAPAIFGPCRRCGARAR